MPYIKQDRREVLDPLIEPLLEQLETRGERNYAITKILHHFIQTNGGLRYDQVNDAIGIAFCSALELYNAVAVPYESVKKDENGPVSDLD